MIANKSAKRVLIYGDSLTYGRIPAGARFDAETRFTGVAQKVLGDSYEVIEEGLRGRMISGENPAFPYRNGLVQFDGIIGSHLSLDLVLIFLGTNDSNAKETRTPTEIVSAFDEYIKKLQWWSESLNAHLPKLGLITPVSINEQASRKLGEMFVGSDKKIRTIKDSMKEFAKKNNLLLLDPEEHGIIPSDIDGIHFDEENNRLLGELVAEFIKTSL